MPADDERREVAARLMDEVGCGSSWPGIERLSLILGVEREPRTGWEGRILTRLAELIYPGDVSLSCRDTVTCDLRAGESGQKQDANRDTVPKESPAVQIAPEFDREALLALADRMEHMAGMGALLTAHGLAMAAASIREACGEVES